MALWAIDGTLCQRVDRSNVLSFAQRYRGSKSYWSGPGTSPQSLGLGDSGAVFGTGGKRIVAGVVAQICEYRKQNPEQSIDLFLPSYLAPPVQDRQRYATSKFDGVHGDVGGTLGKNQHLGKLALAWMVRQAAAAGVDVSTAGLVDKTWVIAARERGWLTPSSGEQATGVRGWARTF